MAGARKRSASPSSGNARKKRFVFKTFADRLEEIDIDVFRSLDAIKFQPTEGTSFFQESLIRWRESNAAADFLNLYSELLPLVQTLPQLLLHKDVIIDRLLSCLQPSAALSLEPILSLIAVLSRDLSEDYMKLIPKTFNKFSILLQQGGDRDPTILQQVFTSVTYIFKYMLKFLSKDLGFVLKVTKCFRFYDQDYVRVFAAEAVSYLFRNASLPQVIKGVRRIITETEHDPSEEKILGCSSLLSYTLKGAANGFHSRAQEIFKLLFDPSVLCGIRDALKGQVVLNILKQTICTLCEDIHHGKLELLWSSLLDEIPPLLVLYENDDTKWTERQETQIVQLMALLNHLMEYKQGRYIHVHSSMLDIASRILKLIPKLTEETHDELLSQSFTFLLNCIKKHADATVAMPVAASSWTLAFESAPAVRLLCFIKGLLGAETETLKPFRALVFRSFEKLIDSHQNSVMPMLLTLIQKLGLRNLENDKIITSVTGVITVSLEKIKGGQFFQAAEDVASVWTALRCLSYFSGTDNTRSICLDYATAVDTFLLGNDCVLDNVQTELWTSLLGAALLSHVEALEVQKPDMTGEIVHYLKFALTHHQSPHVLEAVANCAAIRPNNGALDFPVALNYQSFLKDYKIFQKNLGMPSKKLRLATLQILRLYEQNDSSNQIIEDLFSVESIALDVENSRRISSLVAHSKLNIRGKPIEFVEIFFHAMVGVLQNRLTSLWDAAMDCLVELLQQYSGIVRDEFISYLSTTQRQFLAGDQSARNGLIDLVGISLAESDLITPTKSLMSCLLRVGQRVPSTFSSKVSEFISMFLSFVDYKNEDAQGKSLDGKEWNFLLKDWLQLLVQLKAVHGASNGPVLRQLLVDRFLLYNDPDVQSKAFDCLLNWKDEYLTTYKDHLHKLISVDGLRQELAEWSVGREDQKIADAHRAGLIPVVSRILYPKLSKQNVKVGKSSGGQMRPSILTFLSALDVKELSTFFFLIIRRLAAAFTPDASADVQDGKPAWSLALEQGDASHFIDWVDREKISELPYKRKVGFLHLVKDTLNVFDGDHLEPYLPAIMGLVFRFLEFASVKSEIKRDSSGQGDEKARVFGDKDMRTLCLKVVVLLLNNFHNINFGSKYWDVFFQATEHSIANLKEENAHGDKPSALLSCFLAMSRNEEFTSLLLRNKCLIPNIFSILQVKDLSPSVHSAVLSFITSILAMDRGILEHTLLPHLNLLLQGLTDQLTCKKPATSRGKRSKNFVKDHLHILSSLSQYIDDSSLASGFLDTMLPFLKSKKRVDPEVIVEVLKILRDLSPLFDPASASKCVGALTPLLASLSSQDARGVLCQCLENIARNEQSLLPVANILVELNAMSTTRLNECDYDRRQSAYGKLNSSFLSTLGSTQTSLLLSHIVFDLESEDMRYNASNCLVGFIKAIVQGAIKDDVKSVAHAFLFSRLMDAMKSENSSIRREWIIVLRELVNIPDVSTFAEFRSLASPDVEVDFFSNIIHVQVHRRIKAMARFRAVCNTDHFSQRALTRLFIPLFLHFLFEVRANKDGNLVDATLETFGCIMGHLQSSHAIHLVLDSFRLLGAMKEHQKLLVRLICILLEKMQRSISDAGKLPGNVLEEKVLPQLNELVLAKDSVNVPVAVVTIKVLQMMPEPEMTKNLPQVFQTITNLLKSRNQDTRDDARAAIVGMVEALGAKYLQFAVKMLRASLKRGYEKHVLGYTVNVILIRLVPKLQAGEIDYCLDDIVEILEEEIFGEVSEEKEVEALARKMKERKQARSYDSLRLIAQVMTFEAYNHRLLSIIRQRSPSPKIQENLQTALKSVAMGIQANPSASDEHILIFVHGIVDEFLKQKADTTKPAAEDGYNLDLLAEFGLNILHSRFKNNQSAREGKLLSMLDPFVQLLQRCLIVNYDPVISGAMRCLSFLLKLPLPAISAVGESIVNTVFSLAATSSSAETPLMQACMKLLTVLLRYCKSVNLPKAHVQDLLHLNVFVDIETQGTQALSLLKAAVERKLVVPEVYDLMEKVQMLLITSQVPAVRQRCSEVLLQFLLDYPLGQRRLQRHIDFLLANLGYQHISGREAALEMLHAVIMKFPDAVLEEQSDSLFLTLITRLVNDKDANVQILLETVLKILMSRVGTRSLEHMKGFLLSWISGDKQNLWKPAAQATGLLVEVMDQKFDDHIQDFWPAVLNILKRCSSDGVEDKNVTSKEIYHVLVLLEKLFQRFPGRTMGYSTETWSLVQKFLLHKNEPVRSVSSRLFGLHLDGVLAEKSTLDLKWLFLLGATFCEQMMSKVLDEEEPDNLVIQNLTSVAEALKSVSFDAKDIQTDRVSKAISMLTTGRKIGREGVVQDATSPLVLIFRRLEKTTFNDAQAKTVLKWYTSVVTKLGSEDSVPYLPFILRPLLKIERSTAPADLKLFAEGVRDEIREFVGPEKFAAAFNQVSQEVKIRKETRKRAQSIAALVDPEKTARKKVKLGLKRGAQKKKRRKEFRKH